jgi:glutamate-1-semialdehyde aminotransferase
MRKGFNEAFIEAGITGQMTGVGSMGTLHWRGGRITNAYEAAVGLKAAGRLPRLAHLEMLNHGVFIPMRSQYAVSTPMTEQHIDRTVAAFSDTLQTLKPYIAEVAPELLK